MGSCAVAGGPRRYTAPVTQKQRDRDRRPVFRYDASRSASSAVALRLACSCLQVLAARAGSRKARRRSANGRRYAYLFGPPPQLHKSGAAVCEPHHREAAKGSRRAAVRDQPRAGALHQPAGGHDCGAAGAGGGDTYALLARRRRHFIASVSVCFALIKGCPIEGTKPATVASFSAGPVGRQGVLPQMQAPYAHHQPGVRLPCPWCALRGRRTSPVAQPH